MLGRRVVSRLVREGHDVIATARDAAAAEVVAARGGNAVDVDLDDAADVRRAVAGCDAVVRLTTSCPPVLRMRHAAAWTETGRLRNEGARLLAGACVNQEVAVYIHESVTTVYADGGDAWLDEDSPVDGAGSLPLRDALTGETSAHLVSDAGGHGVVLRFAGLYASDSPHSLTMAALLQRRRLPLVGRARNFVPSVHLDDAAAAIVAALRATTGVYNVGDGAPMRLRDYVAAVAEAIEAPPIRRLPALAGSAVMGESWRYVRRSQRVSSQRLRAETGWSPSVTDAREGWKAIGLQWASEIATR